MVLEAAWPMHPYIRTKVTLNLRSSQLVSDLPFNFTVYYREEAVRRNTTVTVSTRNICTLKNGHLYD